VIGLANPVLPPTCVELAVRHPTIQVLGIDLPADRAYAYRTAVERVDVGELSHQGVAGAIREAARTGSW
jgi:hypothetical protein